MICYPEDVNEVEALALYDYWLLSDETSTGFLYTVKQLDQRYKPEGARPINSLTQKASFLPRIPVFFCQSCKVKLPVKSRKRYNESIRGNSDLLCSNCYKSKEKEVSDNAKRILYEFKNRRFKAADYLSGLDFLELMALLAISSGKEPGSPLSQSRNELIVTGAHSVDQKILSSLENKGALVVIDELPPEVQCACEDLYGDYGRVTYYSRYQNVARPARSGSLQKGVYLNYLVMESATEAYNISSILYQKIQSYAVSFDEMSIIHQMIKNIQMDKLYKLVCFIEKEFRLRVDQSNVLSALLSHLAENYSPNNIFFTFFNGAQKAVMYIHKERIPEYISRHCFSKFVGDYIQYVEDNDYKLSKTRSLPPEIQSSPFEALFSQLYLNGHFDWNRLSAKEVVALSMESIPLREDVQALLIEGDGQ